MIRFRAARRVGPIFAVAAAVTGLLVEHSTRSAAQDQAPTPRPFSVTAKRYRFEPARIEVFQGDVVRIDLQTEDIAHSWTVDEYRIEKRVSPGHQVTFEFRADKNGSFPFYCNLLTEDGCRQMRGELIVKPRK